MLDLGITVSSNFAWGKHIEKITAKAEQRLWLVIRAIGFHAPIKAKALTYMAMVRSILEFGSVVWSPSHKHHLRDLERVQRKATNFMTCNPPYFSPYHVDYKTRLLTCNLLPTSYRRELLDITFFLKSLNGKLDYNIHDYIKFNDRQTGARTRNLEINNRLIIRKTNLVSTCHFFPHRISRIWNALPSNLRTSLKPLSSSLVIKQFLLPHYRHLLATRFDTEDTCTWVSWCGCYKCSP